MNKLAVLALIMLIPIQVLANTKAEKKPSPVLYNTTVIADHGGVSISKYMPAEINNSEYTKQIFEERRSKKFINSHFPVRSEKLKVGRLKANEATEIKYGMISEPLFLIGYDPVSIDWLKANRGHLTKNKAIGLVVNVENEKQMNELQKIAGDKIRLQPTPGDDLATHLKISSYPFYMDGNGVMR